MRRRYWQSRRYWQYVETEYAYVDEDSPRPIVTGILNSGPAQSRLAPRPNTRDCPRQRAVGSKTSSLASGVAGLCALQPPLMFSALDPGPGGTTFGPVPRLRTAMRHSCRDRQRARPSSAHRPPSAPARAPAHAGTHPGEDHFGGMKVAQLFAIKITSSKNEKDFFKVRGSPLSHVNTRVTQGPSGGEECAGDSVERARNSRRCSPRAGIESRVLTAAAAVGPRLCSRAPGRMAAAERNSTVLTFARCPAPRCSRLAGVWGGKKC